jgi:5-oxopent-3-ene-1,2,5-tricarboxylate decarboxylase/2-hydroxyhepta-2,4-diene-1,7-dioate isomerase
MSLLLNSLSNQPIADALHDNSSTVYGVVLNDNQSVAKLASQLQEPPYKAEPIAPILYIKPKNTFASNASIIALPSDEEAVEVAASIALIISRESSAVNAQESKSHIIGLALVADLSLPHDSYYRPAIREKCFDGALPIADDLITIDSISDIESLTIETFINDQLVNSKCFSDLIRSPAQLLSDVTAYMSLKTMDALLIGVSYQAPIAKAGDKVSLQIAGISQLNFKLQRETHNENR